MIEIALAGINTLPYPAVPQSENAILNQVLTELRELKEEVAQLREENQDLKEKVTALESTELQDIDRICVDIAQDRQRISKLEHKEPQPLQKDRGEILRALIAANGGKMLAKDARQKMHLSRSRFSELLVTMSEYIEIKPYHLRKNQKVLILK